MIAASPSPLVLLAARPDAADGRRFASAGVSLRCRRAGRERGAPMVFLHGGPGQGSMSFQRYAGPALERRLPMVYLDQRGSGRSERLTMPVLVVAGGEDHQAVAGPQRAFAAKLPRGRYLEYPGRGHFMWVEDPERFARDVAAFVGGR